MQLPKGFHPVEFQKLLNHHASLSKALGEHTGLAVEEFLASTAALEKRKLIQFVITPEGDPGVCIAQPHEFTTPAEHAFADSLVQFWDVTGKFDTKNGHIVSARASNAPPLVYNVKTPEGDLAVVASVMEKLRDKGLITEKDGQFHGPSKQQVMQWVSEHGVCDFCSDHHAPHTEDVPNFLLLPETGLRSIEGWATCDTCHAMVQGNRRKDLLHRALSMSAGGQVTAAALKDLHVRFWKAWDEQFIAPKPHLILPHWQVALDQKINAIDQLKVIEKLPADHPKLKELQWMDLWDDLTALRVADVYSFSAETMHAIRTGAQSIPHESSLQSVELPTSRAGWFWFAEPYPVAPSPAASDTTAALLWTWEVERKTPTIRFSAYVQDDKKFSTGKLLPSAKWLWPIDLSFHDMIGLNRELYLRAYGKNGPFAGQEYLIGEKGTLEVIAELSLFFLMSCLWFRQTVPGTKKKIDPKLTQTPGHIERHARKRYMKELKLDEAPTVQVVALRKSAATVVEHTDGEKHHHLHVRFVVTGHPRLQPYGPGRKERKLIWIEPFIKGSPDMPFKESGPRVFAVVR